MLLSVLAEPMVVKVHSYNPLQVAFAIDVGKYVEEILLYMSYTVKIDPSGALLCVQQVRTVIMYVHFHCTFIISAAFECTVWYEYCCTTHPLILSIHFFSEFCNRLTAAVSVTLM